MKTRSCSGIGFSQTDETRPDKSGLLPNPE